MILLFDLAGVLLEFCGVESTSKLSAGAVSAQKFGDFWSKSPVADHLYRGRISPEEFASGAVTEWALTTTPTEFLIAFRQWLVGPYEGAFELLAKLRRNHTLACLSNTNVLDCERFRAELRLHERFDFCFFSNEIGLRKPDIDCYRHVLERLNAQPAEVVFFDDNLECVEGAKAAGISAYQCVGLASLRKRLAALTLL
ncbi:MAG TPA: HAD family phosphatase [Steroidobacteraceae bacterium]|nr:HAD family phosphatase [Steroidobacteraceae bacterium]